MTYTTFVENQLGTVHFVVRNGDWNFLNMALFPGTASFTKEMSNESRAWIFIRMDSQGHLFVGLAQHTML